MKLFKHTVFVALAGLLTLATSSLVVIAAAAEFGLEPTTNQGKKWRIAYYEGGPYFEYQQVLGATVRGLMKYGWIEPAQIPPQEGEDTSALWQWLSTKARSDYLEFVADAHYSSNWDEQGARESVANGLLTRLSEAHDIDLVIAMGTWAGDDLANIKHATPTLVFAASDPVAAGIIKDLDDSGLDHVHAAVDPSLYERQIRIFHEMIHFGKLGVAYEDTMEGKSYAALDVIKGMGKELGFEVVPCHTRSDIPDLDAAAASVIHCFEQLVKEADAIYVTMQGGVRFESIPQLVQVANKSRVPTFSQAGSAEVKHGFLASISQGNFSYVGEFNAQNIAKVFNGAQPRQLTQKFEPPPKIAINLKTAEVIDFNPPIILLGAADEIFNEIPASEK